MGELLRLCRHLGELGRLLAIFLDGGNGIGEERGRKVPRIFLIPNVRRLDLRR